MAEPDREDPKVEAVWVAEAIAKQYLRGQQVLSGSVEPEPAWFLAPVVAFWRALGGRSGEPVYWVITGDLPTARYLSEGKEHPTIHVGTPQDRAGLAPMLRRRADILYDWASEDEHW